MAGKTAARMNRGIAKARTQSPRKEIKLKDRYSGGHVWVTVRDGRVVGVMGADPARYMGMTPEEASHHARYGGRAPSSHSTIKLDKDDARMFGRYARRMEQTRAQALVNARTEGFAGHQLSAVEDGWEAERADTTHGGHLSDDSSHATRRRTQIELDTGSMTAKRPSEGRKIRPARAKKAESAYIRSMSSRSRAAGHASKTAAPRLQRIRKKSPAQLEREIAEVLSRRGSAYEAQRSHEIAADLARRGRAPIADVVRARKRGSTGADVSHARRKARAPRLTPYHINLTPDEQRALEFARGRYAWPDMLSAHVDENGAVSFTESEMWQWADDVDSDAEGGHSPFPLASGALVEKLQHFYDSRV